MKKSKKMTAFLSAMAITLSVTSTAFCAVAEEADTPKEIKVSFNITEDMTPAVKTDASLFDDVSVTVDYFNIPNGSFEKDGYMFSGWTINGIDGYFPGEIVLFSEDMGDDIVFEPVWYDSKDTNIHNITYNLDFHGEIIEYPEWLKDKTAVAGQIVTPDFTEIQIEGAYTHGLTIMDGHTVNYGAHFVMPDDDVVVTPIWFKRINFIFKAGDVDRLNGSTMQTFPKNEGSSTDLPASDRFSRDGFNLVGWISDYDGETYKPLASVTCPDVDVTFTAVWAPKNYNVIFKQGNGGANLKVAGLTDTQIICPDPNITVAGKIFTGWKDDNGDIYPAGSEYTIPGAKPGVGIMLNAVWSVEETYESLKYINYGDYIAITGCDNSEAEVVIPAEIDGVPVRSIASRAFALCSDLTSVTIPDSVTNIGSYAFLSCVSLKSVAIPNGIISLEEGTFMNCSNLTTIDIPAGVTKIENSAFLDTAWLEEQRKENPLVIVGDNILIDGSACSGDVIIPDGVKSIVDFAFNSSELTSVTIPESVESIGMGAFSYCSNLTSVKILNPDCEIAHFESMYKTATVYGYENSTAQVCAEKWEYKFESLGKAPSEDNPEVVLLGDANEDGVVDVADAAAIIQSLGNKDKYALSEQGAKNADCYNPGDGITGMDALAIQKLKANMITSLPEIVES